MVTHFQIRRFASAIVSAHLVLGTTVAIAQTPLPEARTSTTGYETVQAALTDLHSKPDVSFSTVNGWAVATDKAALTVWSFAPKQYPAYPAVVKRQVVQQGSQVSVAMSVLCEASKADCDDLVRTFSRMNGFGVPQ